MLQTDHSQSRTRARRRAAISFRHLSSGEFLFLEGDAKRHIYRVEAGAVCVYAPARSAAEPFIEFAYAGDWITPGYLASYAWRARALAAATVSQFPLTSLTTIVEKNARARDSLSVSIEREFAFVRRTARARQPTNPMQRVVALLVSLATISRAEGRNPAFIADTADSTLVAGLLSISPATLSACLTELERLHLIEPLPGGALRLRAFAALEAMADACP